MPKRRRKRAQPRLAVPAPSVSEDGRPIARIGGPGELALVIPQLLDFVPEQSLVVLSLREPRGRVGLVQRIDLPPEGVDLPDVVVEQLVARAVKDGATRVAVCVWSDEPSVGPLPWSGDVDRLLRRADDEGLLIAEAMLVRCGRWWSYLCEVDECCPGEGTPLPDEAGSTAVGMVAAERALAGRSMLASREAVEATIAPELPFGLEFALRRLVEKRFEQLEAIDDDEVAAREELVLTWSGSFSLCLDPRNSPDEELQLTLIASLIDGPIRDEVMRLVLEAPRGERGHMQRLLELLCRQSVPPFDSRLCQVLAWTAYLEGGGAIVTIALERALADDADYGPPQDTLALLEAGVSPKQLEAFLRRVYLGSGPEPGECDAQPWFAAG